MSSSNLAVTGSDSTLVARHNSSRAGGLRDVGLEHLAFLVRGERLEIREPAVEIVSARCGAMYERRVAREPLVHRRLHCSRSAVVIRHRPVLEVVNTCSFPTHL